MTYAVNPPPFNPYHPPSEEPSAPPPYPTYGNDYQNDNGFFGVQENQEELGVEMLKAVVANKTEWVPKATIPLDTRLNRALQFFASFIPSPSPTANSEKADQAKLYLKAGQMFYAEVINDKDSLSEFNTLRKVDDAFDQFLQNLPADETNPEACLETSLNIKHTPEAYFALGKLNFLRHKYGEAVYDFHQAQTLFENLEESSSYRKRCFKALTAACAGAANERLGLHDEALFDYIDASKIDPNGAASYSGSLSRNFQILKFKTHKSIEELQACIQYDPFDPEFHIELSNKFLNAGQYDETIKLLNRSIELGYQYKPSSLYRSAELLQQAAFAINNTPYMPAYS